MQFVTQTVQKALRDICSHSLITYYDGFFFLERVSESTNCIWMKLSILRRLEANFIHFHNDALWPKEMKDVLLQCCRVIPNFVTEQEEASLLDEINPHLKRMRYEKSHWDDVMLLFFFIFTLKLLLIFEI